MISDQMAELVMAFVSTRWKLRLSRKGRSDA